MSTIHELIRALDHFYGDMAVDEQMRLRYEMKGETEHATRKRAEIAKTLEAVAIAESRLVALIEQKQHAASHGTSLEGQLAAYLL